MSAFATISPVQLGSVTGGAGKAPATGTIQQQPKPENIGNDAIGGALSGLANNFNLGTATSGGSFNSGDFFKGILGGLFGAAQGALTGLQKKNGATK
jgi:hypothetical protein